jgi:hypothetical protein
MELLLQKHITCYIMTMEADSKEIIYHYRTLLSLFKSNGAVQHAIMLEKKELKPTFDSTSSVYHGLLEDTNRNCSDTNDMGQRCRTWVDD